MQKYYIKYQHVDFSWVSKRHDEQIIFTQEAMMVRYQKNLLYSILHSYTLKENSIDEEQTLKMFTQDEKKIF
jgi:hypothetical protein